MPAAKEPEERYEVFAVRIPKLHIETLRARGIKLGPHVRRLVETLLGAYGGRIPWKASEKG